jgi:hypothetical protein
VLIDAGFLLLEKRTTDEYWQLPGTTLAWGQDPEAALSAYLRAAAYLETFTTGLLYLDESCSHDEQGRMRGCTRLFYRLQRGSSVALSTSLPASRFSWVEVTTVTRADLAFAYDVMRAAQRQPGSARI